MRRSAKASATRRRRPACPSPPSCRPPTLLWSCLPIGHDERWEYTINVRHQQDGLYTVQHGQKLYGTRRHLEREPGWPETGIDEGTVWLAAHRFDHDTALRLARELAPRLTYRGRTVADALAEGAQRISFLKLAVEGAVTGLLSGAAVSLLWQLAFGSWPSLLELLVAGQAAARRCGRCGRRPGSAAGG